MTNAGAVVVGAGPNGLAAAIEIARTGRSVAVLEARETVGGGARSAELTLPGFLHDVCSTIHPLALASPFFKDRPLRRYGVEFVHPQVPLAHPLPGGRAAVLARSLDATADSLGADAASYRRFIGGPLRNADRITPQVLGPFRPPRHPVAMAAFALRGLRSIKDVVDGAFSSVEGRALLGGLAAHSMLPLTRVPTAAVAVLFAVLAHDVGWPLVRGGSQVLVDALAEELRALGGAVETGRGVKSLGDIPRAAAVLFDLTPRQVLDIAGDRFPPRYRRALDRFRYGPGVFKLDWALDGPIPWTSEECAGAGTVHVCGTFEEVAESEATVWQGRPPDKPFVIVAQQSMFDDSRAPEGKHTAWAYCHVPNGSSFDMTERVEAQMERFAPGFKDRIIARRSMSAGDVELYNANYVGGDINGGVQDLRQLFTRPVVSAVPYATPDRSIYFCSSSTPPGGGVHGMCGYFAARAALKRALR